MVHPKSSTVSKVVLVKIDNQTINLIHKIEHSHFKIVGGWHSDMNAIVGNVFLACLGQPESRGEQIKLPLATARCRIWISQITIVRAAFIGSRLLSWRRFLTEASQDQHCWETAQYMLTCSRSWSMSGNHARRESRNDRRQKRSCQRNCGSWRANRKNIVLRGYKDHNPTCTMQNNRHSGTTHFRQE